MITRTVLATIDGSAPYQRLQVSLIQRRDGRVAIDLCEQHYAEGIGWFDQRTLALEPRQLQQLAGVLKVKSPLLQAANAGAPSILPFPGPQTDEPRRSAVGDQS